MATTEVFPCGPVTERTFSSRRSDSMSCNSIRNDERRAFGSHSRPNTSLDVKDITVRPSSASQSMRGQIRPTNLTRDIAGCASRVLHPTRANKPDRQLLTADITGYIKPYLKTERRTDPNRPDYKMPSTRPCSAPLCRGPGQNTVRHESTRSCAGIDKSSPCDPITQRKTKPTVWNSDIEGAQRKQAKKFDLGPRERAHLEEGLQQRKKPSQMSKSKRRSDPLSPRYSINGATVGAVRGSHRPPTPEMRSLPNRSLDTADILGPECKDKKMQIGAQSHGLVALRKFERFERTQLRNTNYTADIQGASACNPVPNRMTSSKRCTNPLTASKCDEYPYLGASQEEPSRAQHQPNKPLPRPQSAVVRSPTATAAPLKLVVKPVARSRPQSAVQGNRGDSRTFSVVS